MEGAQATPLRFRPPIRANFRLELRLTFCLETDHARIPPRRHLGASWSLEDFASQVYAARRQDVAAGFGGDLARAAAQVRARMLVIYSWDDHSVTAESAAAFAKYVRADTLSLASPCGHLAPGCEMARIAPIVRQFLAR